MMKNNPKGGAVNNKNTPNRNIQTPLKGRLATAAIPKKPKIIVSNITIRLLYRIFT